MSFTDILGCLAVAAPAALCWTLALLGLSDEGRQ